MGALSGCAGKEGESGGAVMVVVVVIRGSDLRRPSVRPRVDRAEPREATRGADRKSVV